MHYAVLGSGRIGAAIARDLLANGAKRVFLADSDWERLSRVGDTLQDRRLYLAWADLSVLVTLGPILREVQVAVSAAPYSLNPAIARECVERGVSFLDLGGHTDSVDAELQLDRLARHRGCYVIPDCGLMPGLGNILAGDLARKAGRPESVRLWVGGLPRKPAGPLNHELFFSIEGLHNEYVSPVRVLRHGREARLKPLTGVEPIHWPPYGDLEAFHTGGSASTLPRSLHGRVGALEVKTIRYRGHLAAALEMRKRTGAGGFKQALRAAMADGTYDRVLMRVQAEADRRRWTYEMVDEARDGETAMMRTTAWPAAIVAQMCAAKSLGGPGAKLQENDVPAEGMIDALARRGVAVTLRIDPVIAERT